MNEKEIIKYIKQKKMSGKNFVTFDLGKIDRENEVSPVRNFQSENYFTYIEDNKEILCISKDKNVVFSKLINFEITKVEVKNEELVIHFLKNSSKILSAFVDISSNRYEVEVDDKKIIIPLSIFDNIIYPELLKISIDFKSYINDEYYNSSYNVSFDRIDEPLLPSNINFIKSLKGYATIYKTKIDEEYIKAYLDFVSEKNENKKDIFEYHSLLNTDVLSSDDIFNHADLYYKKFNCNGKIYFVCTNNFDLISNNENLGTKIKPNTPKKKKKLVKLAKTFHKYSTYEQYENLKVIKRKIKQTPYIYYVNNLDVLEVKDNTILIDSFFGNDISSNLFAIAKTLVKSKFKQVNITYSNEKTKAKILAIGANPISRNTNKFYTLLITSKIILTDSTLPYHFVKNTNQVIINVWHGTPLKTMGKSIEYSKLELANTQRNFLLADKISLNSQFAIDIFSNDYMIQKNKFVLEGAAKIDLLLNPIDYDKNNKKIIVWMPTWRGEWSNADVEENLKIVEKANNIAGKLKEQYEIYFKPHQHIMKFIDFSNMENLKTIPTQYDIYEFLSVADILISDYSSIIFDFAVLNKKIILDLFDKELYLSTRGTYIKLEDLPFVQVNNETELIEAIESEVNIDYSSFNELYNPLEEGNSAEKFIKNMFKNDNTNVIENKRKKILIYPGSMITNGITTSFLNLMENVDETKNEYVIFYPHSYVKNNVENILKVKSSIDYIVGIGNVVVKDNEMVSYRKFVDRVELNDKDRLNIGKIFRREADRLFGETKFDYVINFSGYEAYIAEIFNAMDAKKVVYVHNQMKQEYELRRNFNKWSIFNHYKVADRICPVNDKLTEIFKEEFKEYEIENKVFTCHNTIDFKGISSRAEFEEDYLSPDIKEILDDKDTIKFINIARFSPEKGIPRLIEAFKVIQHNNKDKKMKLILVGAHGTDSERIMSAINNDILIFRNINPLPLLKKSNLFVLSSYHEGLPMVFFEALVLNVPIISTEIPGPKEFMEKGYGNLCENSTEGIIDGMQAYIDNELNIDIKSLKDFNKQAVNEFESIFE